MLELGLALDSILLVADGKHVAGARAEAECFHCHALSVRRLPNPIAKPRAYRAAYEGQEFSC